MLPQGSLVSPAAPAPPVPLRSLCCPLPRHLSHRLSHFPPYQSRPLFRRLLLPGRRIPHLRRRRRRPALLRRVEVLLRACLQQALPPRIWCGIPMQTTATPYSANWSAPWTHPPRGGPIRLVCVEAHLTHVCRFLCSQSGLDDSAIASPPIVPSHGAPAPAAPTSAGSSVAPKSAGPPAASHLPISPHMAPAGDASPRQQPSPSSGRVRTPEPAAGDDGPGSDAQPPPDASPMLSPLGYMPSSAPLHSLAGAGATAPPPSLSPPLSDTTLPASGDGGGGLATDPMPSCLRSCRCLILAGDTQRL